MKKSPPAARNGKYSEEYYYFCKEGEQNRVITRNKDMNMEPSIKDKYIILGFIFVAICMISFYHDNHRSKFQPGQFCKADSLRVQ